MYESGLARQPTHWLMTRRMVIAVDTSPPHVALDDIIEPATLAAVLRHAGLPAGRVEVAATGPVAAGYSGARLTRLTLRVTPRGGRAAWWGALVLKEIAPCQGWLGAASEDHKLREVQLWRTGLLGALPVGIETGVLATGLAGPHTAPMAGALLLRDARRWLLADPLTAPTPGSAFLTRLLDALARLHAVYWEDPRLRDPSVGLTPARAALLLAAPATVAARLTAGERNPYMAAIPDRWEAFLALAAPDAAAAMRSVLADPAPIVAAIARLPATLVHGDVWGPNVGIMPPARAAAGGRTGRRLLLLDWALATAGPALYDPLWLAGTWHALDPRQLLARYRARLTRHLAARGIHVDPVIWHGLVDAAYLRTVLVCGESIGHDVALGRIPAARARWWAARAARGAEELVAQACRRPAQSPIIPSSDRFISGYDQSFARQ